MNGINRHILIGHLGAAPEIRVSRDGKKIASFSLATGEAWRDKATGERREHTTWHNVVIFDENLAKAAEQYLKKGSKVYLEGAVLNRKYEDKAGAERWITETVLRPFRSQLVLLDAAERRPGAESDQAYSSSPPPRRDAPFNDDVPF